METSLWTATTTAGEQFPAAVRKNLKRTLLTFDFDGTLSKMNPDPEAVTMVEASAQALERLARAGVRIAIISGRPVEALVRLGRLKERPAFADAIVLGQYGVERLDIATGELRHPPVPESVIRAREDLENLVAGAPGAHLEDKGRALAVHTRRMENPEASLKDFAKPVREIADEYGLTVEPGRLVWELRAAVTDKGDAMRELISEFAPRALLMAGDDLGDLAAFDALGQVDLGVSTCALVSGSAEQPALVDVADILARGPDGVAAWLHYLAQELGLGA